MTELLTTLHDALFASLLTPIGPFYLWTYFMFGTLLVLPAGLFITRDWDSSIPDSPTENREEA